MSDPTTPRRPAASVDMTTPNRVAGLPAAAVAASVFVGVILATVVGGVVHLGGLVDRTSGVAPHRTASTRPVGPRSRHPVERDRPSADKTPVDQVDGASSGDPPRGSSARWPTHLAYESASGSALGPAPRRGSGDPVGLSMTCGGPAAMASALMTDARPPVC